MYNFKERITPDTLLEGALLVVAAYLAIKIFEPLLTVAFFVAAGISSNTSKAHDKWPNLSSEICGIPSTKPTHFVSPQTAISEKTGKW